MNAKQIYENVSPSPTAVKQLVTPVLAETQFQTDAKTRFRAFPLQTRLKTGELPHQRGNCLATAIGCLLGMTDPEAVFQVQEHCDRIDLYDPHNWLFLLDDWLLERGVQSYLMKGHLYNERVYLVIGESPLEGNHACLYQNGKLVHDPSLGGRGLLTEEFFMVLVPLSDR